MTIAALRRLLDQEQPDVRRPPAPRLNLPHWSAKETNTMTTTTTAAAAAGPAEGLTAHAWDLLALDFDQQLVELLAWADNHDDDNVRADAVQAGHTILRLVNRRRADAELAANATEMAELEKRLAQLRERQAELAPPKPKAKKNKPGALGYDPAEVRAWARGAGITVSPTGRVPGEIVDAWRAR